MKAPLLLVMLPALAIAQPKPGAILDDLATTHRFDEVALSPDGHRVAWAEKVIEKGRDTGRDAIFEVAIGDKRPPVKIGEGRHLVWSHDGTRLAYIDKQVYVATIGAGAKKLTNLAGYVTDPAWAPDDKRLAVLFAEHAGAGGGPLGAEPVETGVIGSAIHNQRLTLIDARSGAATQLSPPALHVYEYDWSPDGKTFALTAAAGPGDNNWWIAQLYTMPADTGAVTAIHRPTLQITSPRWSPDGATIAFIGGLMSDEGFTGGDIYTIAATGGTAIDRTPNRPSSPSTIAWTSPSKLVVTEYVGGSSAIGTLDLASGKLDRTWQGDERIDLTPFAAAISWSRDGQVAAVIRADWQHPPEIWAGPIGAWKPITQENSSHHPVWGDAKNLTWKSDGLTVQGWLIYPRDYDAAKTYPMVVVPHGGPAGIEMPEWPEGDEAIFSAAGYFVFLPNPRGSFGQGEAFVRANVKDFGGGDMRDILAGVDTALKSASIDPKRLGIMGWSYGGYMTMWAITQTNRFKAAIAGAGIADWLSYYGENSIDQWMTPYFGASVYDDPAMYAKSSPITFVKRVKTPTLILVGDRDGECPPPQSYELWHALRALGVPTDLVVYPNEGHVFVDSAHKRDRVERGLAWFEKYLR